MYDDVGEISNQRRKKCDCVSIYVLNFQAGDPVPSVEVCESTPGDKVNVAELFKGKTGVLFAVPGAFTPGCSKVRR